MARPMSRFEAYVLGYQWPWLAKVSLALAGVVLPLGLVLLVLSWGSATGMVAASLVLLAGALLILHAQLHHLACRLLRDAPGAEGAATPAGVPAKPPSAGHSAPRRKPRTSQA